MTQVCPPARFLACFYRFFLSSCRSAACSGGHRRHLLHQFLQNYGEVRVARVILGLQICGGLRKGGYVGSVLSELPNQR